MGFSNVSFVPSRGRGKLPGVDFWLSCVWSVAGHSALTQVVMGSPDLTTNGEVGGGVNLPATR